MKTTARCEIFTPLDIVNKMLDEAKRQAIVEADKVIQAAQVSIQKEKEEALKDIRRQVAVLSLEIAEKIMRQKLANETEQTKLVEKLLDEMRVSQS